MRTGAVAMCIWDIPSDVVVAGAPCRVVREISDHDRRFSWRDKLIDEPVEDLLRRFTP